jgi:hypothetical protein
MTWRSDGPDLAPRKENKVKPGKAAVAGV